MKAKLIGVGKIVGISLVVVTAFAGGMLFQANNQLEASASALTVSAADFAPFWKVWQLINQDFVSVSTSTSNIKDKDKIYGAIDGLVNSLGDPYSAFLPPEENKMFEEEISGNFGGVGIEIGIRDGGLTVISPLPDTPAKKAGILAGDKIVEIEGKPAVEMSPDEAVKLIRGTPGTAVTLSITREKEETPRTFKLVRANIKVPTIETVNLPGKITQIKLFNFSAPASSLFEREIKNFAKSGNKFLILDLRGNPGGYLESAIDIAGWFLPKGAPVVIEDHGDGETKIYPSAGHALFTTTPKMVVLVDKGSASASEILAGALRENGVAKVVGEQTFGKGSVQELFSITKDTSLKLTVARWLTPHGISISQNGLKPDYAVSAATSTTSTIDPNKDPQLQKAIQVVKGL